MKKLDDDVMVLKSMGCITIAEQYKRMAKALLKIRKYAESHDFIFYVENIVDMADAALKRFKGGEK